MNAPTIEQIDAVYAMIDKALESANLLVSLANLTDSPPTSVDNVFADLRDTVSRVGVLKNALPYIEKHGFQTPIGAHLSVAESAAMRAISICLSIALRNAPDAFDITFQESENPGRMNELFESHGESIVLISQNWSAVRMVLQNYQVETNLLGWLRQERLKVLESIGSLVPDAPGQLRLPLNPEPEWVTRKVLHDFMKKHSPSSAGSLKSLQKWPRFEPVEGKKDHVADYQKLLPWLREHKLEFPWPDSLSNWD